MIFSIQICAADEAFTCSSDMDITKILADRYTAFDGNIDYPTIASIAYIKRALRLPNINSELRKELNVIFKTAVIVSDAIESVTGNQSVAVAEFLLKGPIESDNEIMDLVTTNGEQLMEQQKLQRTCDAIQSIVNIIDLFEKDIINCMNQIRQATTIYSRSTVEDIYKSIVEKYNNSSPDKDFSSKELEDLKGFGIELENLLKQRDLRKPFHAHIQCVTNVGNETETELQAIAVKLKTIAADEIDNETNYDANKPKESPDNEWVIDAIKAIDNNRNDDDVQEKTGL